MGENTWVADFFAAVDQQDWEAVGRHLASDVVIEAPGFTGVGPDAVSGWMTAYFVAFPDLCHRPSGATNGPSRLAVEVGVSGTHAGILATPAGPIQPSGRVVDLSLGEFWDLDAHGSITRYRVYFDQLDFLRQLGLTD